MLAMKRNPIILFPEFLNVEERTNATVGELLRIGKPSRLHYEFIHHSLEYDSHKIVDIKKLLDLEGDDVKIASILKMKNGRDIAVLVKKDGNNFLEGIDKLFVEIKKALESKELLFLN